MESYPFHEAGAPRAAAMRDIARRLANMADPDEAAAFLATADRFEDAPAMPLARFRGDVLNAALAAVSAG